MRGRSFDVAVIGGGIVGLALAWRARARGLSVILLERGQPGGGTSSVAAGMLAPATEADAGEPALLALGLDSAARWPDFAAELEESSGIDVGYRASGTLLVARDRDEAEALERERELRERFDLRVGRLIGSAARRLEPALAPSTRLALLAPDDHSVDPRAVCRALAAATEREGVHLRRGAEVVELMIAGGCVTGVALAGGERVAADRVAVAAGPWSAALPGIPRDARVPVRPVKGQTLRLRNPAGLGLIERAVRWIGPTAGYLVPRADGELVLGATVEERGFDTTVTALGVWELLRDAAEIVPGVLELTVTELLAGMRPGTPDNAPLLGAVGAVEGLYYATGHHRNGVLLAPITAELVAAELAGDASQRPHSPDREDVAHPFSPDRFAGIGV
jgi:glycine oxidase